MGHTRQDHIRLKAYAKINLAIDVLGVRPDGYHDLRMIMQTIELHDIVLIKKNHSSPLELTTNDHELPTDRGNLAYAAADYLINEYGIDSGVLIELEKNIPIAAGLAGGSSDCAAVLIGMRDLFGLNIDDHELLRIGGIFGADVPFCIMGGTALAEGKGERLTRLAPHPAAHILLAHPTIHVSTAEVFNAFDPANPELSAKRPDIDKLIDALQDGDIKAVTRLMRNALETVTEIKYPVIGDIKAIMSDNGSIGALMSGSGPTVIGYFESREQAELAAMRIGEQIETVKDFFITGVINGRG